MTGLWKFMRNIWRWLVNMRTAIVLLCLLALAAIPGEIFPQRVQDRFKVEQYIADHGNWGKFLDKLQMYDVFESYWFTGIYLLLFLSLIACIIPRVKKYFSKLLAKPSGVPSRLARQSKYQLLELTPPAVSPTDFLTAKGANFLKGWKKNVQSWPTKHTATLAAEKGYLKEFGNLLFHISLLGLLVAIVCGKLFFYEGDILLTANGKTTFCTSSPALFDTFRAGKLVDGTKLTPLCLKVNKFTAKYLFNGQPDTYNAQIAYSSKTSKPAQLPNSYQLEVNKPLRTNNLRVYLMAHGYAPIIKVTFPDGRVRIQQAPFRPENRNTSLSAGVIKFPPPPGAYPNFEAARKHQLAIEGILAPTAHQVGANLISTYPALTNPILATRVYVGDTGLDSGINQSIFALNEDMITQGRLKKIATVNLTLNKPVVLPAGYTLELIGIDNWVSLQVSHDPAQLLALIFAILGTLGLVMNFAIRPQQIWVKITPQDKLWQVELAGSSKESKKWDNEFKRISTQFEE